MDAKRIEERIAYVEQVTRKVGGLEGLRQTLVERTRSGPPSGLEGTAAASPPVVEGAVSALESLELRNDAGTSDLMALEAIIDAEIRPAIDIVDGKFTSTHPLWTQLSQDPQIRERIEKRLPSIGRIELPGHPRLPYGGTGFVVGKGLVMTNRHVAEVFASGLGTRRVAMRPRARAGIDFLRESGRPTGPTYAVRKVLMIHPYWDMALLAVDGIDHCPSLTLSVSDARDRTGHDIFVVGYPAYDSRNPADEQNTLFDHRYGVKRLQPGELQGAASSASFGKIVNAATHDCSTLGGNSGSAVMDLVGGDVLALHFGGLYHQKNFGVPSCELARDQRVVDAGVTFAGTLTRGETGWAAWWRHADGLEAVVADRNRPPVAASSARSSSARSAAPPVVPSAASLTLEVPLRITVSLGDAPSTTRSLSAAVAGEPAADALEALREPWHDTDYDSRTGYDEAFLNTTADGQTLESLTVPMPDAADPTVLALTKIGADILHYENFSIRMHAKRRLALVTASNVTKESALRRPVEGEDYSRDGLGGLTNKDTERWFLDERLADEHQLPDVFFTKDRKAFDKGHLVRREDVAWGADFPTLRRANGDTYHVTNCSPQVAPFNRSNLGEDNWGDLENHVLSEAATERLCVFAGPVLDPADTVFLGKGDGGVTLRAKIPSRYWKVIVARDLEGLAAFGFVLEQSLEDVAFEEFVVPDNFVPAMVPIADIATVAGVVFADEILEADRYDKVQGSELAFQAGLPERKRLIA